MCALQIHCYSKSCSFHHRFIRLQHLVFLQASKAHSLAMTQNVSFRDNPTFVVVDVDKNKQKQQQQQQQQANGKQPTKGIMR